MAKTQITSLLSSKALPFIVAPLIVFVLYQLGIVAVKAISTDQDISALQKQVDDLEKSQQHLQEFNAFLNSDFFVEKEARIKLGMQKAGERVVVLPKSERSQGAPAESRGEGPFSKKTAHEVQANPQLWWEYFFGS